MKQTLGEVADRPIPGTVTSRDRQAPRWVLGIPFPGRRLPETRGKSLQRVGRIGRDHPRERRARESRRDASMISPCAGKDTATDVGCAP